jgi:hypothetical protein
MPQIASIESESSVASNDPPQNADSAVNSCSCMRRLAARLNLITSNPARLGYSEGGDLVLTGLLIKTSPSHRDSRTAGSWLSCIHAAAYCQQLLAVPPPGSPLGAPALPIEGPGGSCSGTTSELAAGSRSALKVWSRGGCRGPPDSATRCGLDAAMSTGSA